MRRAISVTTTPGARLSATIARFCSALQRRRRSGPVMISTLAIAPPLTPVLTPLLALVLTSPNQSRSARRPSPDQQLSVGQFDALQPPPLVLVPRVGGLERIGPGRDRKDQVEDVFELQIADARSEVDPVACMKADTIFRKPAQRVTEISDPPFRP